MTSGLPLPPVLLQRIELDYQEQPGLRLTPPQAQRLWDLDGPTCCAVLTTLVPSYFDARRTAVSCAGSRPRENVTFSVHNVAIV